MRDDVLGDVYRRAIVRRRAGSDGTCPSPEALLALAERTMAPGERHPVAEHLASCADCQRDLALLAQVAATREARRHALVPAPWLAAAAVLLLAVVGGKILATRGDVVPVARSDAPAVTLVAPHGPVPADPAPTFVWHSVEGARRYEVEVLGPDAAPVATASVRDTVMPPPDGLGAGARYRWRVTAVREDGTRLESVVESFDLHE